MVYYKSGNRTESKKFHYFMLNSGMMPHEYLFLLLFHIKRIGGSVRAFIFNGFKFQNNEKRPMFWCGTVCVLYEPSALKQF
jgi:hypothetical protein